MNELKKEGAVTLLALDRWRVLEHLYALGM